MADTPTATQTMVTTLGATVAKTLLMTIGAAAASHGVIGGSNVETFVSLGMMLIGAAWSFWNSYGRAIVLSKLEVWKATAQAQAEALHKAQVPGPTAAQIADKIPDPAVTAQTVTKVMTAGCLLLAAILLAGPAMAETVSVTVRVNVQTHHARPAPRVVYVPRPVFIPYFGTPERFPFFESPMRRW